MTDNKTELKQIVLNAVEKFSKSELSGYSGAALNGRMDMLKEFGYSLLKALNTRPQPTEDEIKEEAKFMAHEAYHAYHDWDALDIYEAGFINGANVCLSFNREGAKSDIEKQADEVERIGRENLKPREGEKKEDNRSCVNCDTIGNFETIEVCGSCGKETLTQPEEDQSKQENIYQEVFEKFQEIQEESEFYGWLHGKANNPNNQKQ